MSEGYAERVERTERAELQDRQRARRRAELGLRAQRLREREARERYDLECAQRLRRQVGLSPQEAASLWDALQAQTGRLAVTEPEHDPRPEG